MDDNVTITGPLADNTISVTNGMRASGNTTFGGPLAVTSTLGVSGRVQTPAFKCPGTTTNDNPIIQNNTRSEVARFKKVYRCTFSGNSTILGYASVSVELYSTGPATCNQTLKVVEDAIIEGTRSNVVFLYYQKTALF